MGRGLLLAPCGLVVEHMQSEAYDLVITARPASRTAACPTCGSVSARVHSTYQRALADLPSHGQAVRICSKRGSLVSHSRQIVSETASEPKIDPAYHSTSPGRGTTL